ISDVVRPQIAAGAERAGRPAAEIALVSSVFAITGPNDAAIESVRAMAREQIAFYASTPTYRVVLECHGWQDVGEQLSRLAAARRWGEMGALSTDQMLDVFAVTAPLDQIGAALRQRYDGVLDRVFSYMPYTPGALDDAWRALVAAVQG